MAAVEPCQKTVADSEKKTIQTPPKLLAIGNRGAAAAIGTVSANTSKRLIKARWEKEGQRRSVIIPAGNTVATTIGCNWLQNVNRHEQEWEQFITIWGCRR